MPHPPRLSPHFPATATRTAESPHFAAASAAQCPSHWDAPFSCSQRSELPVDLTGRLQAELSQPQQAHGRPLRLAGPLDRVFGPRPDSSQPRRCFNSRKPRSALAFSGRHAHVFFASIKRRGGRAGRGYPADTVTPRLSRLTLRVSTAPVAIAWAKLFGGSRSGVGASSRWALLAQIHGWHHADVGLVPPAIVAITRASNDS